MRTKILEMTIGMEDMDRLYGHAGYDAYLRWFKRGHLDLLDGIGIGLEALKKDCGLGNVVRHAEIDYKAPISHGDRIVIRTKISGIGSTSVRYSQTIEKGDLEVSAARMAVVFVDKEGKPAYIPSPVRQKLQGWMGLEYSEERYDDFGAPFENGQPRPL